MNHTSALAEVYVEACKRFRQAKEDGDLAGMQVFRDLCEALEIAYPATVKAIREYANQ